jgi:hypothetical protein
VTKVFLRPGKTGGTALTEALRVWAEAEIAFVGHEVRLADVPQGEQAVFVLRDPVTRFVSAFNSRLREGRPRYHYPWSDAERHAFERFTTPDQLACALSSSVRDEAEAAMRGIGHLNTFYSYWFGTERDFRDRLDDVFFIGFQETLADDFERLKGKLALPAEASLPRDERLAHKTPDGFSNELSPQGRKNLEVWYAVDICFYWLCRELAPALYHADQPPSATRFEPVT